MPELPTRQKRPGLRFKSGRCASSFLDGVANFFRTGTPVGGFPTRPTHGAVFELSQGEWVSFFSPHHKVKVAVTAQ